jgi:hypothetical protein
MESGVCPKSSRNFLDVFLPLANPASVDDYIVIVRDAVNSNGSKGEVLEVHGGLRVNCTEEIVVLIPPVSNEVSCDGDC